MKLFIIGTFHRFQSVSHHILSHHRPNLETKVLPCLLFGWSAAGAPFLRAVCDADVHLAVVPPALVAGPRLALDGATCRGGERCVL